MCKKVVLIEDIEKSENKELQIHFEDFIDGIKTEGPIKSDLKFQSLGDYIKVTGKIAAVAILECDLCLREYEYYVDIDIDELFAKYAYLDEGKQEVEIKEDGFVTDLNGEKEINVNDFIYQSIILEFPNKKVCDINCNGGDIFIRDENPQTGNDPRMSIFKDIKIDR